MTVIQVGAPIAALLVLSSPVWAQTPTAATAQAAPAKPRSYLDSPEAADALNGQEMAQLPVVVSPPHPIAPPAYPAPAYYPPPPAPGYPPPPYYRPF
jgi:hypothetical protein